MTYRVTAGYVTVETKINDKGARAQIDIPRGADLPADVPQEQVDTLLRRGRIEEAAEEAPAEKPLEKRTVAELKAYATENEIDLGGAAKKPAILAAIAAAQEGDGEGDGQSEADVEPSSDEGDQGDGTSPGPARTTKRTEEAVRMGGAIYFPDENGNTVKAGADHPLPVTGGSSEAAAADSTPEE